MIPKLPRWIWSFGLTLLVLNGLLFVLQSMELMPTHSRQESAGLIIGLTIGTALATWYWGAKWVRLRHQAKPGRSLLSLISLHRRILIGVGLLVIITIGLQGFRMSFNPALRHSEDFVRANEAVLDSYGPINDLKINTLFWNVKTTSDGTSTGNYTFDLSGTKRTGTVRIYWRKDHEIYTAMKIDEFPNGDLGHPQTLWQSK